MLSLACLHQAKPQDTLDLCQLLNNDLAATIASHPRRFVGLGTLPMQAPELAVKEMERCVRKLGFPGVQIGSHINEWDLNARELFPVYAVSMRCPLSQRGAGTVLGVPGLEKCLMTSWMQGDCGKSSPTGRASILKKGQVKMLPRAALTQ